MAHLCVSQPVFVASWFGKPELAAGSRCASHHQRWRNCGGERLFGAQLDTIWLVAVDFCLGCFSGKPKANQP